jgi:glycosyltransferase involved in cell wall biosynthesis
MHCRLCYGKTVQRFSVTLLGHHRTGLHECAVCGSLQTDPPHWLDEAYADPRPITDTGIVQRTLENSITCADLLARLAVSESDICVDFGGGNGLFSRMMRDKGFNFFCFDRYVDPFYVPHHAAGDHGIKHATVVTCFEVLEHLPEPAKDLMEIFSYQPDLLIATTSTYQGQGAEWPYLSVENGQHVFFYSAPALGQIAEAYGYHLITTGSLHLFCRRQPHTLNFTWRDVRNLGRILNEPELRGYAIRRFFNTMNTPYQHVLVDHAKIVAKIGYRHQGEPSQTAPERKIDQHPSDTPPILIEGSFFHDSENSGIARVWMEILALWAGTDFGNRLIFLDRAGTVPPIPGIRTVLVEPPYNPTDASRERHLMQRYCDHFGAGAFISTYYSAPLTTPTAMLINDMIPERLPDFFAGMEQLWAIKHQHMAQAKRLVCISENTRADVLDLFPNLDPSTISVAPLGVCPTFGPQATKHVLATLNHHHIDRPYLVFVGQRGAYKNAKALVAAWQTLPAQHKPLVVFVGGGPIQEDFKAVLGTDLRHVAASDQTLAALYSGALALVFPSLYEGFGLPILEAMACDCPVICSNTSSLPEVAGDAALFVSPKDPPALAAAILRVQDPSLRDRLINAGRARVTLFSWQTLADELRAVLEALATPDHRQGQP